MDLKEELTRQSLLLEFISECVSLQSVSDLTKLVATRLHWICDYDTCTTLLPGTQGLSLWSQDRKAGAAVQIEDDVVLSRHKTALKDAMAKSSPTVAHYDDSDLFLAALPLGSSTVVHGALCVARAAKGFSQGDVRHLQHASSAVGGALTRIAALVTEREAEATLRESEERHRTLFETIDEGFCVIQFIDGPHGPLSDFVHLEANPAYMRHAGIPDVVGKTGRGKLAESEADAWVAILRGVLETGESVRFERELNTTDRYLEVACSRIEPAAKQQVAIIFQDISARKQAEQRLRELNETLESQVAERTAERDRMWNSSPDLMLVIDFEGYFRRVNPAWTELLGYTPDELVGRHVNEFVIHADHASTVDAYEAAAAGSRPAVENRYRHKDGSVRWISWVAAPAGNMTYATGRNITAEKERNAELAARTAERDQLWNLSQDMLARASYEGSMSAVSPAWTQVLGWSEPELLACSYASLIHPEDISSTFDVIARMGEIHQPARFENRIATRDGGWKYIEWTVTPELDGKNFVAVGRDLSLNKAREAQLEQAQAASRQSQKMEAVGQLTSGIAHDFNNLLAAITGSMEIMRIRISQGRHAELERYVAASLGAARKAAALTHRLLAFARQQTLKPKPIALNRLVAGMEELITRTVGTHIHVETVAAGGLWNTLADESQLENALLNLCINARDAMPDGGSLTIETANRWLDERGAAERDVPPGQYVSLCVSDNGTGMTPEVIARAFDPFFTTKSIGQGSGLGLSMVFGFARQSGGQVRIYSEGGDGTMVCIYLPRHLAEEASEPEQPRPVAAPEAPAGQTILIVEDEPALRMLIVDVMTELGYATLEAEDSAVGLKILQSNTLINLLISDIGLPGGMNGRQMAEAALHVRPYLKVLFITGYAENAVFNHGHLVPGMQVLTKPFEMAVLATRVHALIEQAEDKITAEK